MPVKREDMSPGQLALVGDGFPAELILTPEERREGWRRTDERRKIETSNDQRLVLPNQGETDVIARRTNSKKVSPAQGVEEIDFKNMGIEELRTAHNLMADDLGVEKVSGFETAAKGLSACNSLADKLRKKSEPAAPGSEEKEADMAKTAKKTTAKKTTAKKTAKAAAAPKKEVVDNRSPILKEFGAREGTNRAKMITALSEAGAKGLKRNEMLKKVYGSANVENAGALNMVWKGVPDMIKKERLGAKYDASVEGKGEEAVYSLKKK